MPLLHLRGTTGRRTENVISEITSLFSVVNMSKRKRTRFVLYTKLRGLVARKKFGAVSCNYLFYGHFALFTLRAPLQRAVKRSSQTVNKPFSGMCEISRAKAYPVY